MVKSRRKDLTNNQVKFLKDLIIGEIEFELESFPLIEAVHAESELAQQLARNLEKNIALIENHMENSPSDRVFKEIADHYTYACSYVSKLEASSESNNFDDQLSIKSRKLSPQIVEPLLKAIIICDEFNYSLDWLREYLRPSPVSEFESDLEKINPHFEKYYKIPTEGDLPSGDYSKWRRTFLAKLKDSLFKSKRVQNPDMTFLMNRLREETFSQYGEEINHHLQQS